MKVISTLEKNQKRGVESWRVHIASNSKKMAVSEELRIGSEPWG
jgi:hypothetical protein